jgi:cation diffusion facilitator family transporter
MMESDQSAPAAGHSEKRRVALSSVLAAVLLTGIKLAVGLLTGSLGILAEAAHSGLDLAAAVLTFFAVRYSGRAADPDHPYGHGKIENISALFEIQLLLVTCAWIIYHAARRLTGVETVHVDANIWAFLVVIVSIVIDVSRSRALSRVAKKYGSQALEADALHFFTDIWSSAVVLVGLVGVRLAAAYNIPVLERADTVAALGVAGISIWISLRLGKKTIGDLMDSVPPALREGVHQAARNVPGVLSVTQVRVRRSGPGAFADVTVAIGHSIPFESAHDITRRVEEQVRTVLPKADVVVHAEPAESGDEDIQTLVRALAARRGLVAHNICVIDEGSGGWSIDLHLEMDKSLSVGEAHAQADAFERAVRKAHPAIVRVTTHLEPAGEDAAKTPTLPDDRRMIREAVEAAAAGSGFHLQVHDVEVKRASGILTVSFHCVLDAAEGISSAHEVTSRLEQALRARVPEVGRVVIHVEPREG